MAILTGGKNYSIRMDQLGFAPMAGGPDMLAKEVIRYDAAALSRDALYGEFTYDASRALAGGELTHVTETLNGSTHFDLTGFSISAVTFVSDPQAAIPLIFALNDSITGSGFDDVLLGFGGDDIIQGQGGYDSISGGDGNDTLSGGTGSGPGQAVIRGGLGNDSLAGGVNFDDLNGNEGNDTVQGDAGSDWVVGGKDRDLLFGGDGDDIVYGNLGDDTVEGGAGNDIVRGGQGNDVLTGGAGADWLSGDLGDDTISGGAGADIFHTFSGAGVDRVVDFHISEGDRVMLEAGTAYSVAQVGSDVVITVTNAAVITAQMTLVGVSLSSLGSDWVFGA